MSDNPPAEESGRDEPHDESHDDPQADVRGADPQAVPDAAPEAAPMATEDDANWRAGVLPAAQTGGPSTNTALLMAGAGALLIGAGIGSGSGGKTPTPVVPEHPGIAESLVAVSGSVTPASTSQPQHLVIVAHKADGTPLAGPVDVAQDGSFLLNVPAGSGPVRLLVTPVGSTDMQGTGRLSAVTVLGGDAHQTVAITPLTTLASLTLGNEALTSASVTQANEAVARWFGLSDILQAPHPVTDAGGAPADGPDLYGRVLAVLTSAGQVAGMGMAALLSTLAAALPHGAQAIPPSAEAAHRAATLLLDGLEEAAASDALDGPSAQTLVQLWTQMPVHLGSMRQATVNGLESLTLTLTGDFKAGDHVVIHQDGAQRADLDIIVAADGASLRVPVTGASLGHGDGLRQFSAEVWRQDGQVDGANALGILYDGPPDAPTLSLDRNHMTAAGIEPGGHLEYSIDGGLHWLKMNNDGCHLADGRYEAGQVMVRQIDAIGQVGPAAVLPGAFDVDTFVAVPTVGLVNDTGLSGLDGITRDATVRVGDLEAGGTWSYSLDGGQHWTQGQGTQIDSTAFPQNGQVSVIVRQTDAAGNTAQSAPFAFVVDNAVATPTLRLAKDTGVSATDHLTADGRIVVTDLEPGASWRYSVDGGLHWVHGKGDEIPASAFTGDGYRLVLVQQTDLAGNISRLGVIDVEIVTSVAAPTLWLVDDTGTSKTDFITRDATVGVGDLANQAHWEFSTDGGQTWLAGHANTLHPDDLPPGTAGPKGEVHLLVRQTDAAGNLSTPASLDFIWDTQTNAPSLTLPNDTGISATDRNTRDATLVVGDLEPGASWDYRIGPNGPWVAGTGDTIPDSAVTTQGDVRITVRQTDPAGNTAEHTETITVDRMVAPPVLSLQTDSGVAGDGLTQDATIKVDDLEDGARWEYQINGGAWLQGSGQLISAAAFSQDGDQTVLVRQTDTAGNQADSTPFTFVLERSAPAPTLILTTDTGLLGDKVTSDASLDVTGLKTGASWRYSLDGQTWHTGTGTHIPGSVFQSDGAYDVLVQQEDAAGNISPTGQLRVVLDTQAAAPTLSLVNDTGTSDNDLLTNDGALRIENLEANATWEYRIDGGTWTAGLGNGIGSAVLTHGVHHVEARQTDIAGNVSTAGALSISVDQQVDTPTLSLKNDTGSSSNDGVTSDATVTIDHLEADATWSYRINGGTWETGTGTEIPADAFTTQGLQNVEVVQTDAAGNQSVAGVFNFELLTVANTTSPVKVELKNDSGSYPRDRYTNDATLTLTGLDPDCTWSYSLDNGQTWHAGTGDEISTSVFPSDGTYRVIIRETDRAGNETDTLPFFLWLDTTVATPTLELKHDTGTRLDDLHTSNGTVNIQGIEAGASWEYRINGGAWTPGSGRELPGGALGDDGPVHVEVRQTDAAGNVSDLADLNLVLDTLAEAPTLGLLNDTGSNDKDLITRDGTVTVSDLEPGATWQYRVNGGAWTDGTGTEIPDDQLTDGQLLVEVKQTDVAGNESPVQSLQFQRITQVATPTLELLNDTGADTNDQTTNDATVTVGSLVPGATWQYTTDSDLDHAVWIDGVGDRIPSSAFSVDGNVHVTVRQTDEAGNTANSQTFEFQLDREILDPTLELKNDTGVSGNDRITSDGTVKIGQLETGAHWQYSLDGVDWLDGTGNELPTSALGDDGVKQVLVRQTDTAGNVSGNALIELTLTTSAPSLTPSLAQDTGSLSDDLITHNAEITIDDLVEGASWEFSLDGQTWVQGSGTSLPASTFTTDGSHTVQIRQTDSAGNVSPAASLTFTLDTSAQAVTLNLADDSGPFTDDLITNHGQVNVTDLEDGATWRYSTDGGQTWQDGTGTTLDDALFAALVPDGGEVSVQVVQTDKAGNESAATSLGFTLLPQGPAIDLQAADGLQTTQDSVVGITGLHLGQALTNTTAALSSVGLQTLHVRLDSGFAADDQLVLDHQVLADQDVQVTGITIAGIADLSYQYDSHSRVLSISKTDGTALTGLEATRLTNALQLANLADHPADGDRQFSIYGRDMAGNLGAASVVTITVDTRQPSLDLNGTAAGVDERSFVTSMLTPVRLFSPDMAVGHENPQAGFTRIVITETGGGFSTDDQLISSPVSGTETVVAAGSTLTVNGSTWSVAKISNVVTLTRQDGQPASASEVSDLLGSLHLRNTAAQPGQGEKIFTVRLTDELGHTALASGTVWLDQTPPQADLNGSAAGQDYATAVAVGMPWSMPVTNPATAFVDEATFVTQITVELSSSVTGVFSTTPGQQERLGLSDGTDHDGSTDLLVLGQGGTLTNTTLLPGVTLTLQLSSDAVHPLLVINADTALSPSQASALLRGLRYESDAGAPTGDRVLTVLATDIAGNTATSGTSSTLTVLPAGTPMVFLDEASDTGTYRNDNVTRLDGSAAQPLTLIGVGRPGATLTVYRDANNDGQADASESIGTAICDAKGVWHLSLAGTAMADGNHAFLAVDAGAQLRSPALTITVDTRPPASSFGMGDSVSLQPRLAGVSDPNERVVVELDTDNNLANGYELRYETTSDAAGHWLVDTRTAPSVSGVVPNFSNGDQVNARVTSYDLAGNETVREDSSTATASVFSISDSQVVEGTSGQREMVFLITRDGDVSGAGSVAWKVNLGESSARANSNGLASEQDYDGASSGTVSFAAGETQKLITFNITGDNYREVNERLVVNLEQPTGGLVGDGFGVGNINEVDISLLQAAYSLRDVNANLNTAAIRVRRSSDNQEADIGFDANGNLDTKTLRAFVGTSASDRGFVTIWYDQSGNGRDMVQPLGDKQGLIVDGGQIVTRSDGSAGISFNTRNGARDDYMYSTGIAANDWRSTVIYSKVQSEGSANGSLFNLGESGNARLNACYPEAAGNNGYVFDVTTSVRLARPVTNGNSALIGNANDVVFEAHSGNTTAGSAAANFTDSAMAIFENGINVAATNSMVGTFSTSSTWQLARHAADSLDYYQQVMLNEFMVYLAKDNSVPNMQSLEGSAASDVLTYAGETGIQRIDGLAGHDTLYLSGSVNLDFAQMPGGVHGIEQVWMDNGQANTLTLSRDTLAANGSTPLTIVMGAGDSLILDGVRMDYDAQHRQAVIVGQDGNDVIVSTILNDAMRGGGGADTFTWLANHGGKDTVLDFNAAQGDKLDLTALLQQMAVGGESLFLQKQVDATGQVSVLVDWDGHGNFHQADLVISLPNTLASDPITIQTGQGTTVL
ncbi:type I secretion C-terminal target domain (VC_A0849 subclass) [Roseateles sp. YR242]|uniref:Ig-like domain-containing protein n=1 Tax=Roseateles sp. YR242 TaxID=1855305 RepID=UPI0008B23190|nr:Ig-like domain-containing protein [Roseateles sp. YR242]SEK51017.1 type I secretion C-terminal target domain (VC_A0849 subclass) [Roseateles sp. YR242]